MHPAGPPDSPLTASTPDLLGTSAATRALDEEVTSAGRSDAKVLITGESGVGKEVAARLIHARSSRQRQPLVTINCAGLPDSLLESELFGHVKGSFTGAYRDKPGLLQLAHTGTIFLDEVGEMSLRMQALLLRFLESGEIQQVGADRLSARLDVRVICATHRDLKARIADGAFREDLFYRLNVIHIHIPPLRERPEDIRELIAHFVRLFSASHRRPQPVLAPEVMLRLLSHRWPGNVRELKNVVERLVLRDKETVTLADLPLELRVATFTDEGGAAKPGQDDGSLAVARQLLARMLVNGESFWQAVYEPFQAHDLTRQHLRLIVGFGLEQSQGRYSALTELFNMKKSDYKKFLGVLRKHDCLVPFHAFRTARTGPDGDATAAEPRADLGPG
jgi:transcriptional regulator with PAS, ATPase and Fis domain